MSFQIHTCLTSNTVVLLLFCYFPSDKSQQSISLKNHHSIKPLWCLMRLNQSSLPYSRALYICISPGTYLNLLQCSDWWKMNEACLNSEKTHNHEETENQLQVVSLNLGNSLSQVFPQSPGFLNSLCLPAFKFLQTGVNYFWIAVVI